MKRTVEISEVAGGWDVDGVRVPSAHQALETVKNQDKLFVENFGKSRITVISWFATTKRGRAAILAVTSK